MKYVTFSFDDGTLQDERLAIMFDKYNIRCTFNINSGQFGQKDTLTISGITVDHSHIPAGKIAYIFRNHEVAVHTVNHPALDQCTDEKIIYEVEEDRKNIEALVKYPVIGMAYPGGPYYNDHVIDVILKNTPIKYARDIKSTLSFNMPEDLMKWHPTCHYKEAITSDIVDSFIQLDTEEDKLLYIWGHTFEFDIYNDWENFEQLLVKLSSAKGLTFVTNKDLLCCIN